MLQTGYTESSYIIETIRTFRTLCKFKTNRKYLINLTLCEFQEITLKQLPSKAQIRIFRPNNWGYWMRDIQGDQMACERDGLCVKPVLGLCT